MPKRPSVARYKRDGRGRFATANLPKGLDPKSTRGRFELAKRDKTRKRIRLHRLKNKGDASPDDVKKAKVALDEAKAKLSKIKAKMKQPEANRPKSESDTLLDKLKNNDYTQLEEGLGGITASYLVRVDGDGQAIVKPQMTREIAEMLHLEEYTQDVAMAISSSESEVAAYDISKRLGFGIVPETAMRSDGASIQAWVEDGIVSQDADTRAKWLADKRSMGKITLLDAIIGNEDRHDGNSILKDDGTVVAIDHGGAFEAMDNMGGTGNPYTKISMGYVMDDEGRVSERLLDVVHHPDDVQAIKRLWDDDGFLDEFEAQFGSKRREVVRRGMEGVLHYFGIDTTSK